jgi:hypothetical protein
MNRTSEVRSATCQGHSYEFVCDPTDHASWWTHEDEVSVREAFWNIQAGDVVFDIGAAHGAYTLSALAAGAQHVMAWSPEQEFGWALAPSLEQNGWAKRATIFTNGLWCCRADHLMFPLLALDDQIRDMPVAQIGRRVDVMKIDTEGAELAILMGALDTIDRCKPRILVEHHNFIDSSLERRVRALLNSLGYQATIRPFGRNAGITHGWYVPA